MRQLLKEIGVPRLKGVKYVNKPPKGSIPITFYYDLYIEKEVEMMNDEIRRLQNKGDKVIVDVIDNRIVPPIRIHVGEVATNKKGVYASIHREKRFAENRLPLPHLLTLL